MPLFLLRAATIMIAGLTVFTQSTLPTAAHAQLELSNPQADSLLVIPPTELALAFTEPIQLAAVTIAAVDERGQPVQLDAARLDPASDRRILVSSDGFSIGTYTVSWSNRSDTDGHTLSGSFAFRVGGTGGWPVAATVEGERPPGWGIVTRWFTFLGVVMAVGLLLAATSHRRVRLAQIGLTLALVATAVDPVLLSRWPPAGSAGGSVGDAFRAEPDGWWIRLAGIAVALALSIVLKHARLTRSLMGAAALLAIGGLSLTSHSAGRETYAWAAVGVTFLHNATLALWIGALALIAAVPDTDRWAELRQFAKRALPLALIAVAAGVVNAVLLVPSVSSLTGSYYGRVLLAKSAVVVVIFGLAAYHHRSLRRQLYALPGRLQRSMRLELGGIALAVALASTLALLAPPVDTQGELDRVEIGMPTQWQTTADQMYVRLDIEPVGQGATELTAYATDGPPLSVETDASGALQRIERPAMTTVQLMRLELSSLNHDIAPRTLEMAPNGDGIFGIEALTFSAEGWWRAVISVRLPAVADDLTAEFILRSPDPNFTGFDAAVNSGSNPAARSLFERAIGTMRTTSWTVSQDATSGDRGVETSTAIQIDDAYDQFSPNVRVVQVDGKRYLQIRGGEWQVSEATQAPDPSTRMSDYDGASSFVLGASEEVNGRTGQIIMFFVPGGRLVPAFYAWWVDIETGVILKEAMVSRNHYMNRIYNWLDEPEPIEPPTQGA